MSKPLTKDLLHIATLGRTVGLHGDIAAQVPSADDRQADDQATEDIVAAGAKVARAKRERDKDQAEQQADAEQRQAGKAPPSAR